MVGRASIGYLFLGERLSWIIGVSGQRCWLVPYVVASGVLAFIALGS